MSVQLEEVLSELEHPISLSELPDIFARIQTDILLRSALSAGATEAVGGLEASTVVAAIGTAITLLPLMLLAALLIFIMSFWRRVLLDIVKPIPIAGPHLVQFVSFIFPPPIGITDWAARKYEALLGHLWNDITNAVGYFATRFVMIHHINATTSGGTTVVNHPADLSHVEDQIHYLTNQYESLWNYIHNHPAGPLPQGLVTLPEQIYKLQQDVQVLYHNQQSLHTDVVTALHMIHQVNTSVETLGSELTSVRSVQVGWQDFVDQANKSFDELRTVENHLAQRIDNNTRSIGELAPLSLLLEPGIRGLRNLRKLEDKPCQCPQPKFMSPRQIEALAMLEYIENG